MHDWQSPAQRDWRSLQGNLLRWLLALAGMLSCMLPCALSGCQWQARRESVELQSGLGSHRSQPASARLVSRVGQPLQSLSSIDKVPTPQRLVLGSAKRLLGRREPSNNRHWRPDLAILPYAEITGERVKIYHVRDCHYRTEEDYDVRHLDLDFPLASVRGVDFIIVPFQNNPLIAHTMLSFGLVDGRQIVISVEGRLEQGEKYSTLGGSLDGFELMFVIGTEHDLIGLRTEVRKVDVYLYPTRVTPEQAQRLLVAMLNRANALSVQPEFYDTLTNNCTTNIVRQINELKPGSIPADLRVLLPGHSDRLAYDLGLIATELPFEVVKPAARVNLAAHFFYDSPDFSARIRGL
jgi:hypothetical protein